METFSALLAFCAGSSTITDEVPAQRPVTRSFDFFFDLRLKHSWANDGDAGDLRRHRTHYDVIVMNVDRLIFTTSTRLIGVRYVCTDTPEDVFHQGRAILL